MYPVLKDVFTVAEVFKLSADGHITHVQTMALLGELERKPLWMRVINFIFGI